METGFICIRYEQKRYIKLGKEVRKLTSDLKKKTYPRIRKMFLYLNAGEIRPQDQLFFNWNFF